MAKRLSRSLCVIVLLVNAPLALAQAGRDLGSRYTITDTMIAARDGVRLHTLILAPKNASEPLPFIMMRTPYGIEGSAGNLRSYLKDLADEGYIFVFQDIRGRYKSEGKFVMSRPPRKANDPKSIDESTDAYDSIDWLVKNVPNNNGRVGILGISYDGWLTVMAMLDPHPALKAVSPQASPADMWMGDDFHHHGAFRLSYGFEYVAMMETSKVNEDFHFDRRDTFEWYLNLGALSNVNVRHFGGRMPTWNDFVAHPNYDVFWKEQAFAPYLNKVTVPTLNVAGWWDQEDFYGPLTIYSLLEKKDTKNQNFMVVGPWNHGGWAGGTGQRLGKIGFDSSTAEYFRQKVQAPWFAFHLKDKGPLDQPEALMFQTGSNRWERHDQWPPVKKIAERKLYMHEAGKLSFDAPGEMSEDAYDKYISDPSKPIPYRPRPIDPTYGGPGWPVWLLEDQRFVHLRPDVQTWETEPLDADVSISGQITAHLFASTSGTDSDWIVKLIDVYPEHYAKNAGMGGYQLMVANEVFRGRYRKSFSKPEALTPNQPEEFTIDLHWANHCFRKGHKIMVQVQSSWFPVIDRNPQKFVKNIFEAKDSDYQAATQRIYRSAKLPTHIMLPVRTTD